MKRILPTSKQTARLASTLVASCACIAMCAGQTTPTTTPTPTAPAKPAETAPAKPVAQPAGTSGQSKATPTAKDKPAQPAPQTTLAVSTGIPQKDTLIRMMQRATVSFNETRLEEVLRWVVATSGADVDLLWIDDRNATGLNKDTLVTAKFENKDILHILEGVLERFGDEAGTSGATWQMTESGAMQIGTKDRLNKFKRLEVYPVRDLMLEPPNYTSGYDLDIQQALQQANQQGGGGGGQSPFQDRQKQEEQRKTDQQKSDELIDLITTLVESEQWERNGGDAGSIRFFQGALLIKAPDYMHRAVNGYPYWPKQDTTVSKVGTRRYVSLGMDTGVNKIKGFENIQVDGPK